jgi:hypothetical protein
MAHLFRLSDEAWAAIDRHLVRAREAVLAPTTVICDATVSRPTRGPLRTGWPLHTADRKPVLPLGGTLAHRRLQQLPEMRVIDGLYPPAPEVNDHSPGCLHPPPL